MEAFSLWSDINPLTGKEENLANKTQEVTTHKITTRYNSEIKSDMRIEFNNRIFEIVSIINPMEKNQFLEILAKRKIKK